MSGDTVFLCKCGCGKSATTKSGWVKGHWNKGRQAWNKGLDKFDDRVKKYAETLSKNKKGVKTGPRKIVVLNSCACGCGQMVKNKWAWGHHSRVNNISKRLDIREKRRKFLKEQHAKGLRPEIWNKGLTKEDDDRVAKYGRSQSENYTEERRQKMSSLMKESWKSGNIVPLIGPDHSNWKGGISVLLQRIRGSRQLYKFWKYPILVRDKFKCQECGNTKELEIHHNKETMSEILQEFVSKEGKERTFEEDSILIDCIVQYHVDKNISGITICKKCHKEKHPSYNY